MNTVEIVYMRVLEKGQKGFFLLIIFDLISKYCCCCGGLLINNFTNTTWFTFYKRLMSISRGFIYWTSSLMITIFLILIVKIIKSIINIIHIDTHIKWVPNWKQVCSNIWFCYEKQADSVFFFKKKDLSKRTKQSTWWQNQMFRIVGIFLAKKRKFAIWRKYLHSWRTIYLFNICCNVFFSNGLSRNGSTSPHSGLNVWKGHGGFCIFTVGIWGHGGGLWSLIGFLKKKVKLSTFDLAFK